MLFEKVNSNEKKDASFSLDRVFQDGISLIFLKNKQLRWATVNSSGSVKLDPQKYYLGHIPIILICKLEQIKF